MTYTEFSQMKEKIKSVIDCTPATFSIDQANAYLKDGIIKIIDDFIQPEQIIAWTEEEKKQVIDALGKVAHNMAEVLGHLVGKSTCYGCKYGEDCEEKQQKETADGIPADIKPGTKQAKIYGLLKDGQTAKEIIATKEFAPESVYIVARKHFPDAITPNGKNVARVKKEQLETPEELKGIEKYRKISEDRAEETKHWMDKFEIPEEPLETEKGLERIKSALEEHAERAANALTNILNGITEPGPAPEKKEDPVEKLEKMERVIRNAEKREELKKRAVEWLRAAIEKLEAGELVKCRTAIAYAIGLLEKEAENEHID